MFDLVHMGDKTLSRGEYIETRDFNLLASSGLAENVSLLSSNRHSPSAVCLQNGVQQLQMHFELFSQLKIKHISNPLRKLHALFLFFFICPIRCCIIIWTSFTFILNLLCAICYPTLSWDTGQTHHFLFWGNWAHSFVFVLSDEIRRKSPSSGSG